MKYSILKTGVVEVVNTMDSESGELLDSEIRKHTYLANTKETFFLGYSSLIGAFMEMSQAEIRIFGYCMRYAKGVKFDISKKIRLDIHLSTGLNERTVLNTLPNLLEKKLLYKHSDGLYQLNPRYAFEGSSLDRNNHLKILIELGCIDC
jgi:hypothetical protein